jgi:hypothetical protein
MANRASTTPQTMSTGSSAGDVSDTALKGTTYRVYRYIVRQSRPVGISDVQKGLGLSSPSVSDYHIRKLLQLGLIREEQGGYVVERMVLENIVRIGRMSFPVQTGYVAFFGVALLIMLVLLRPVTITSSYEFGLIVIAAALGVSIWETRKTLKRL